MIARLLSAAALAGGVAPALSAQAAAPRVALVADGPSPALAPQAAALQREIEALFRRGEVVVLPALAGDGTAAGVRRTLDGVLADNGVSVVVTLGPIGSHLLARGGVPRRPAVAATIVDAGWQGLPQRDGTSGVRGLAYVDESHGMAGTLAEFHRLIPFRRMAVLLDRELLLAVPQLGTGARALVHAAGAEASVVPMAGTPEAILATLPPGTDAVYLTPSPALDGAARARLLAGLAARRLPALSHDADDVRAGALASYEPPEQWLRRARRVAVDVQRILAGEDAGTLATGLVGAPRLLLNLATARAVGFSPGYAVLTDAELVATDSLGPADTLSLADAMRGAVRANLDLEAATLAVASGAQDVHVARSHLLPRVDGRFGGTVMREQVASVSLGQQPERQMDGGITFSVPLYSEEAWAGYGAARHAQRGREAAQEQDRLDVALDAARAYIAVLQARTLADVRRSNLHRTRANLETARVRERVGSTSRADVYRWEGEVANARREVIAAESQVQVAALALQRVLNRPLGAPLAQRPLALADSALFAQDSTVLAWFAEPPRLAALGRFLVAEALRTAPELARADAAIAAQRRQRTAAGRALWLPTLSLRGGLDDVIDRDGAGATAPTLPGGARLGTLPDVRWQLRIEATLPLFTGFARTARQAQAGIDLRQLEVERAALAQRVEQRVRSALETAASSHAAIGLTREAADAATRNYELVSDAYARGTASITALIDAQEAAQAASEAAANAVHDFLLDLVRVERAKGGFGALRPAGEQQAFLSRLHALEEQP